MSFANWKTSLLAITFLLTGCSLQYTPAYWTSLKIQVQDKNSARSSSLMDGFLSPQTLSQTQPPSAVAGFSCLAVNVNGPGIPIRDLGNPDFPDQLAKLLSGQSYCSVPGVVGVIPPNGNTVALQVPSGPQRLIQIAGVIDSSGTFCQTGNILSVLGSPVDFYEVGRAITDLYYDQAVAIQNSFDSLDANHQSLRKMNCDSGNGGNSGNPGYPNIIHGEPSLISYWRADDPIGSTALFESSGSFASLGPLTLSGTYTLGLPGPLIGMTSFGANFDGSSGKAVGSNSFNFANDEFTIEAWVNTTSTCTGSGQSFVNLYSGSQLKINLGCISGTGIQAQFSVTDATGINASITSATASGISDGQWHHIVGVKTSSSTTNSLLIFVDGVSNTNSNTGLVTGGFSGTTSPYGVYLAYNPNASPSTSINVTLSEIAVYNTALPQTDISYHYQAGKNILSPPPPP